MKTHTDYLENREHGRFFIVLGIFLVVIALFSTIFVYYGNRTRVSLEQEYYFLVRTCEETTSYAVAGEVYLSGGAGYLITTEEGSAVTLACYFTEEEATSVCSSLATDGEETEVIKLAPEPFYVRASAEEGLLIAANAKTVDTCARVLYDTANGLEAGTLSQEEAKAAVGGVVKVLGGLRSGSRSSLHDAWNEKLLQAEARGEEMIKTIIFSRDVRYLQAELCHAVVQIAGFYY